MSAPLAENPHAAPATAPESVATADPCESVRREAEKYAWDVYIVVGIARAESGCRTDAVGDLRSIRGVYAPSCGAMQIRTLRGRPSCDDLKNLEINMFWAWKISRGGTDFRPWSTFVSGAWRK